ncbi:MAG: AI-2E family transporter [Halioglobus sp.]
MSIDNKDLRELVSENLMDLFLKLGIVIFLVILCVRIVSPFISLILWAFILAIALQPLHSLIAARMGGRQGRSATVLVLAGLLLIGTPIVMLSGSFASQVQAGYADFEAGTLTLSPPKASVADWPVIGEKVYTGWSAASRDLPAYIHEHKDELGQLAKRGLTAAASTAGGVLLFLGSLIVAGILMAYGESVEATMKRILGRFSRPERGAEIWQLIVATIRSVATGVLGVALIQALLIGLGLMFAGVPAAGVLAIVILVLGILQLPATLVTLPVIIWLWSAGDGSTTVNAIFTIYLIVAGLSDNILKPILLGRGVDAPMPVILIGAIGGMVWAGIVGLFLGAVLLAVGYQLFMSWLAYSDKAAAAEDDPDFNGSDN